jgi:predicted P-loop ATPase
MLCCSPAFTTPRRSQLAAGWFNKICDRTKAFGFSAGTEPGERVHPEVVRVMKEEGIDLASMSPQFRRSWPRKPRYWLRWDVAMRAAMFQASGNWTGLCAIPKANRSKSFAKSATRFGRESPPWPRNAAGSESVGSR